MTTSVFRLTSLITLLVAVSPLAAQRPDAAQCRALLAQPTRDSLPVTVGLTVRAFDSTQVISAPLRASLASAIREVLHLPRPLPLVIYTIDLPRGADVTRDTGKVVPTIAGAYAAELSPDGHLTKLRVTGGGRAVAFDEALLRALQMVSDSSLLPPLSGPGGKPIELRLGVMPIQDTPSDSPASADAAPAPEPPAEPLFRMRVPVLGYGKPVVMAPGNAGPPYPELARQSNMEGRVRLRFVVNEDGHGDPGSLQVREATLRDFLTSTLRAFPALRFTPLEFRGCPLPSLVELPFEFRLRHIR